MVEAGSELSVCYATARRGAFSGAARFGEAFHAAAFHAFAQDTTMSETRPWASPAGPLPTSIFRAPTASDTRDSVRGPNGTVVMFICNHCPYVKAVLDKIVRDTGELRDHGVGSMAICSNDPADYPEDSFDNMKALAHAQRFPFPYVDDETQAVAQAYGAVCTPDFFGFTTATRSCSIAAGWMHPAGGGPDGRASSSRRCCRSRETAAGRRQQPSVGCSIKWAAAGVTHRLEKLPQRIEHGVRRFGHQRVAAIRDGHDPRVGNFPDQRTSVLCRRHQVPRAENGQHGTANVRGARFSRDVFVAGREIRVQHARLFAFEKPQSIARQPQSGDLTAAELLSRAERPAGDELAGDVIVALGRIEQHLRDGHRRRGRSLSRSGLERTLRTMSCVWLAKRPMNETPGPSTSTSATRMTIPAARPG